MDPALGVGLLALLFVGTHVGLATTAIRGRLAGALGEGGFFALYTLVASLTLAAVLSYYAGHRFEGVAGLAAGAVPIVHALLLTVIAGGIALMVAGLAAYPRMPMALFGQPIREPYGIERITRHPFFAGVAILGLAHVLLAPRLAGAVLMGSLALLAIAGARHQDAKHLRRRGQPYADYLAITSTIPFAAILAGRQRLVWRELPLATLARPIPRARNQGTLTRFLRARNPWTVSPCCMFARISPAARRRPGSLKLKRSLSSSLAKNRLRPAGTRLGPSR